MRFFYPEYFSFPFLCAGKNTLKNSQKSALWLPLIPAIISSGYTLGLALLFCAPQGYPGYELLRAWSFGGISRFDAAFLLLGWRLRSSSLFSCPHSAGCSVSACRAALGHSWRGGCTMSRREGLRLLAAGVLTVWLCLFLHWENTEKSMIRSLLVETKDDSWTVGLLYQFPEASADSSEAEPPSASEWAAAHSFPLPSLPPEKNLPQRRTAALRISFCRAGLGAACAACL